MSWQDQIAYVIPVAMGLCAGMISFYVSRGRAWRWGFIGYLAGVLAGAFAIAIAAILIPEREAYIQLGVLTIFGGGLLVLVTPAIGAIAGLLLPSKRD
jgi:hypothetical protein